VSDALAGAGGAASTLAADLPVGGRSGTLYRRMLGTPAAGRIEAKTGTLVDVSALSGFALPAAPSVAAPLLFSFIANGVTNATGVSLGDRLAVALATYPQAPPVPALEPLPPTPAAAGPRR
ncbi:MAG: D-alanyl-D-alanine carboxypeptidase, partial [Acidimicrobiales bacterium]